MVEKQASGLRPHTCDGRRLVYHTDRLALSTARFVARVYLRQLISLLDRSSLQRRQNKACAYIVRSCNRERQWNSAGSLGWPFPMLKYKYIFQIKKNAEAILSNSARKPARFEITKLPIAV